MSLYRRVRSAVCLTGISTNDKDFHFLAEEKEL